MKKMYYLEIYYPSKDIWVEQERHDNLQCLYDTMYDWVKEGYMGNKDHIRITEGWVLV